MEQSNIAKTAKKKRAPRKDRSQAKYSEHDFLRMPRNEQLRLAEQYWNGPVDKYDDGTFQFSYTHFGTLCKQLGFRKGVVDANASATEALASHATASETIYIDRISRETQEKKMTLSVSTVQKIDAITEGLGNITKSRVIDAIIERAMDDVITRLDEGTLEVCYKPIKEKRIL